MKKRYLSFLTVLSSFAVVALHVNSNFWVYSKSKNWVYANIIESVFYFAVPVFFMITGATLINYKQKYDTVTFLKKRFSRTVLQYLFWSVMTVLFLWVFKLRSFTNVGVKDLINGIITNKYNGYFWYFPTLFSVYLSLPLLASVEKSTRKRTFEYLIIVTFLFNVIGTFVTQVVGIKLTSYSVVGMSGYLLFTVLGFYISEYGIHKRLRMWIYIFGVLGLLVHIFGTYSVSVAAGKVLVTYKGYLNLPSVLYATAIFTFFRYFPLNDKIDKFVQLFEQQTFGIYLVHWFVLKALSKVGVRISTLTDKFIWTIFVFLVSWLIVYAFQKHKLLKKLV